MSVAFSQRPGRHERHYRRRLDNPLYGDRSTQRSDEALLDMQRLDHEELMSFIPALRSVVKRAVELAPSEESDVVLRLKEDLDRLYEQSAGLADDQSANQAAITELIEVIMRNVERGAAGDPQALDELAQERLARATHFELLREPLVADLLHPDSLIEPSDLAPTLLSANRDELTAALQLFDGEQLDALHADAARCLAGAAPAVPPAEARLAQITEHQSTVRLRRPLN